MVEQLLNSPVGFGPEQFGAKLHINTGPFNSGPYAVIDVETDEKDNYVGHAITWNGEDIYYFTDLSGFRRVLLDSSVGLIGHNIKGDLKWLKNWGVNIKPEQLYYDTCLASYVMNTTKDSHGLKQLANEFLGMKWPTYKEMTGTGKAKQTLDKQPIERVAAYCGLDCLATYRLWKFFEQKLTASQKHYLQTIELPTARILLEMELKGAAVDVDYLKDLQREFGLQLGRTINEINKHWKGEKELNINSNRQVAELLEAQGAVLPRTPKGSKKVDKQTLSSWSHLPVVPHLLEYSKIEKLLGTYIEPLLEKNKEGRIYASFNQLSKDTKGETFGISTGRLSSSNPNLQNIPTRTEDGSLLRRAFTAPKGTFLIDADFSQIEPRLVAHFSKDKLFLDTFRQDRDLYEELVAGTGRDRQDGKTFMLALLYGAQPKKLASVFKCDEAEATEIIDRIMKKLPGVMAWINRTKWEAKQKKGVYTLFKRWIPLPGLASQNQYERYHWERAAVNYIVQGSAAEILKMSLIKLREAGFVPTMSVHDEAVIESSNPDIDSKQILNIMSSVVQLDVPLKVSIGVGANWNEAKE